MYFRLVAESLTVWTLITNGSYSHYSHKRWKVLNIGVGWGRGGKVKNRGWRGQGGGKLVAGGKLNEDSPSPHAIQKKK